MKVAMIAPCAGVGGAAALMLGLVKHCTNIEVTGIHSQWHNEQKHISWAKRACGLPPIHAVKHATQVVDGVTYHDTSTEAIRATIQGADLIWTWCVHGLDRNIPALIDAPIIEYVQNSDDYAKHVVKSNLGLSHYYATCSKTAGRVMPPGLEYKVIYNGIDPSRVAPSHGRNKQRASWNLSDKKILLYMGRVVREKHPEMALTCLEHLPEEWVTVFVGNGDKEAEIYKMAQALYPERVFFVETSYQVGDVLAAADLFFLPSDFEGHSLSLLEAWLAGTPTLCTDFHAVNEMERLHGSMTHLIPRVATPKVVAQGVLDATEETSLNFGRINNARATVWNNYTLPTIAAQWEEFFDDCVFDWRKRKRTNSISCVKPPQPLEIV